MTLREMEAESIRRFVASCAEHFTGRVLDYGCGRQPYRDIVEKAGGAYTGYDDPRLPGSTVDRYVGDWAVVQTETILCTQVIQYVPTPALWTQQKLHALLSSGGVLVMTYPTHWPEVEEADLHRFTKSGMTRLLVDAGFVIDRHERRAQVTVLDGEVLALGYGVVARAT